MKEIQTSSEWLAYYHKNAASQESPPWHLGLGATQDRLEPIIKSLQAWQLGETSDGSHLMRAAQAYAEKTGDVKFLEVARLFIQEEQRHGEMLGCFLDLAGAQRISSNWGDTAFRTLRYSFASMEVWATPVLMVETMALLYYKAIHDATPSRVLRSICTQILRDEVAHIRFQIERLAVMHHKRKPWMLSATYFMQRILFTGVSLAVWIGHGQAFRAGGYTFRQYWKCAWRKMNSAWQRMRPENYFWDENADSHACAAPLSTLHQ